MSTVEDLEAALEGNTRARANYDAFPPFSRKAYVHWISNAKREETRLRRLRTLIDDCAAGRTVRHLTPPARRGTAAT